MQLFITCNSGILSNMNKLLAVISGKTLAFSGYGRKLGYPTANIQSDTELPDGVYFGYANLATYKHQPALIFVGVPVTVGDKQRRVEAHLLDITDIDYYDLPLRLELCHFHRPNQKFDSIELLQTAMVVDAEAARQWFSLQ